MNPNERFDYLFRQYASRKHSEEERLELMGVIDSGNYDTRLRELVGEQWGEVMPEHIRENEAVRSEDMYRKILSHIEVSHTKVKKMTPLWRYAAAVVFLIILSGVWFIVNKKNDNKNNIAVQPISTPNIKPGTNGAILTLDNGKQIILDSTHNGLIAQQGNSSIIKKENGLSYEANSNGQNVVYNTITTPRGKQYPNLVLADGSKVWLDAGSSIRFPVSFTGSERKVEITGQVWFDVVHNSKMPFKVIAKGIEINDLGTQFNVNCYNDEEKIRVTLLQGAVSIRSFTLKPGQQAQIPVSGKIQITSDVNVDQVMAWKNGFFSFKDADIKTVMRQISRWYDIDVSYEGNNYNEKFSGKIGRDLTLKDLLDGLSQTKVHYRIEEGRKLVILP